MKAKFKELNKIEDLKAIFEESHNGPKVLFKHSITCPISRNVFQGVGNLEAEIALIVVQDARKISDAIADKTGIRHESPQAIVIRDGEAIYNASHYDVTAKDIEDVLTGDLATT